MRSKRKYSVLFFCYRCGPGAADAYEIFFLMVSDLGLSPIHSDLMIIAGALAIHFCHGASGNFGIDAADELRLYVLALATIKQMMSEIFANVWLILLLLAGVIVGRSFAGRHQEKCWKQHRSAAMYDPGDDGGGLC